MSHSYQLRFSTKCVSAIAFVFLASSVLPADSPQPPPDAVAQAEQANDAEADNTEVEDGEDVDANKSVQAWRINVPVPISGEVDRQVRRQVEGLLKTVEISNQRPTLILHFQPSGDGEVSSSEFERSLALARFLTGKDLGRVRTVAYVSGTLSGHAVLPVIACEQLVIHPDAEFGRAGAGESFIDETIRQSYRSVASQRRTVPIAVVLGMLDARHEVFRVDTLEGVHYVSAEEFPAFQQEHTIRRRETIIPTGELGNFTGRQLRIQLGFASHLASDIRELAEALGIPLRLIRDDQIAGEIRSAKLDIRGPINVNSVSWSMASLDASIRNDGTNLIVLEIDSAGGAPEESLRLAQWLAKLNPREVKTVAYVPREALGSAALVALACDELVVGSAVTLGGPGAISVSNARLEGLQEPIKLLAKDKNRNWSVFYSVLAPETELVEYHHPATAERLYLTQTEAKELEIDDRWKVGRTIEMTFGLTSSQARSMGLAVSEVGSFEQLKTDLNIEDEPQEIRRNWAHAFIATLAKPRWARVLLFFGFLLLMLECQNPGLSVPGFVSSVCFLLFFWGQFLHGTAHWLEVMLFVAGVTCILLEVFVIPGFGVFGVGGTLMVVLSIVLASQTFVLPQNEYQYERLTISFVTVAIAFGGILASIVVLTTVVPRVPFLRDAFARPIDDGDRQEMEHREMLVNYGHLMGAQGTTTTRLSPSGKARFDDEVISVLSDGELIAKGEMIQVIEVQGSNVRVQRAENT